MKVRSVASGSQLPDFLDYHTYVDQIPRYFVLEGGGALASRLRILFPGQDGASALTTTLSEGIQARTIAFQFVVARI
jgi:hypothetical protein